MSDHGGAGAGAENQLALLYQGDLPERLPPGVNQLSSREHDITSVDNLLAAEPSPDGSMYAITDYTREDRMVTTSIIDRNNVSLWQINYHSYQFVWSPDSRKLLIAAFLDRAMLLHINADSVDVVNENVPWSIFNEQYRTWSPNSERFIVQWQKRNFSLHDENGHLLEQFEANNMDLFEWSSDSQRILMAGADPMTDARYMEVRDSRSGNAIASVRYPATTDRDGVGVLKTAWASDLENIAVLTYGISPFRVAVWHRPTNNIHRLNVRGNPREMSWSPNGYLLAIACSDNLCLFKKNEWDKPFVLKVSSYRVQWSKHGNTLVSIGGPDDNTVRIYRGSGESPSTIRLPSQTIALPEYFHLHSAIHDDRLISHDNTQIFNRDMGSLRTFLLPKWDDRTTHRLFGQRFRSAVFTLMLVRRRQDDEDRIRQDNDEPRQMWIPIELWLLVFASLAEVQY